MFRNYIPTFFTTKNPVFMNYGFNSVMNFIRLITGITFFQKFLSSLNRLQIKKRLIENIHEKIFIVSLLQCTLHILKQSSGFVECKYLIFINKNFLFSIFFLILNVSILLFNLLIIFLDLQKSDLKRFTKKILSCHYKKHFTNPEAKQWFCLVLLIQLYY